MTGKPFDIFRLPDANNDGAISTCIPYRLDITSLAVGDLLEIKMKFSGTGKQKERLVEKHLEDSRVQIIVPINDPEMISPGPPDWIELFYAPGIFLQRKTWDEGNSAKIVIRKDAEESTHVDMNILIVLNKLSLKPDEFHLLIESKKVFANGGSLVISEQEIKFTNDKSILCYGGDDEDLIDQVFSKKSGYEIKDRGSMFHPKQIHSYNSVYRSLESRIEAESPLNISYIGPDTCENLHSTIRAVNSLVSKGLKVSNFFLIFTQWDERSMQSLGITVPGYFEEKGCNFQVKPLRISDEIGIKSDLIISTYVTNWAFNSGKRGTAAEQYLSNILKQIKNENSMIISIDPFDEKRVARSFYQLGHQGVPTIVYTSSGLELQDSAPGGHGDIIQEREREIYWVTSYKSKSQTQAIVEPALPKPNDIAQSLGMVSPTGRDAYLERLSTPMLEKYATWTDAVTDEEIDEEIHDEVDEEIEIETSNDNPDVSLLSMESLIETKENFRIIIGGPGDGKTVFLQQLGWSKRSSEDEVTIILSARRLTRKEHMLTLAMHEGEDKIAKFVEILEKESIRKYESLSWTGNIKNWMQSNLTINLKIDALDEVRDLKSRKKLFSYLLEFCNCRENINVTLTMRQNILSKTMKDVERYLETEGVGFTLDELNEYGGDGIESYLEQIPIYRLTWDEGDIVHKFIPSLLRGWNMVIDVQSKNELGRFITRSNRSLNRSSRGSRTFLKNPLRAVWLVRFVYDQSINLDDMDLSEFENEILRLSVKNRFENRRRIGSVSDSILDQLLDFVATLSVLDYEWAGKENNFTSEEREKFVNLIVTSDAVSEFFRGVDRNDLRLFLYEDMSLLYIADDDNLAWIHENLREHAIARGLMKYNQKNSIPNSLLSSWGFEPPSIYEIFFNPDKTCSIELSEAIRRIIPTSLLIQITVNWLNELKNEESTLKGNEIDEIDGNSELTNLANLISICDDITLLSKSKRDETNSKTKEHTAQRNRFNSKVRDHIKLVREHRDSREGFNGIVRDKKKLRKELSQRIKEAKIRLAGSNSDENESLKSEYNNALREHDLAHVEVQEVAQKAQEAHELMQQSQKELDKLREIAEKEHRALRKSKKDSDVHHNRYIFLLTRLNRELKKRKKSLLSDIGEEMKSEEWQEKVKSSARQFLTQNPGFSGEGRSDINEIFVLPKGHECELIIITDYGKLKLELNDNSFGKLRLYLEGMFQTRFYVKYIGDSIPSGHVVEFIETNLDSIVEEWSGDHKLNIQSWEIDKLTLPNLPKDLENRKIILRSKTPILIKTAGLLSNLNQKLKNVFGNPIYVDCHAIDVNPIDVKERYLQICESKSLTKLVTDIQVTPLENGVVGRNIIVKTSNSEVLTSIQKEAADILGDEFGKPFFINYIVKLPPLELEIVRPKLMGIINRIIGNDSSFFELFDIKSYTFDGVEGRLIQVKCKPVKRLIGVNGSIANSIKEELISEFGFLKFNVSPGDISSRDVKRAIEYYIGKPSTKTPEYFKMSIDVKELTKVGIPYPNRLIILNSNYNSWLSSRKKKILSKLVREFDTPLEIKIPDIKVANLKSAVVKKCVIDFIEQNNFELGIKNESPIKNVVVTEHRGITGREVMIDWPLDSAITEIEVKEVHSEVKKQLRKHLYETFEPPFAIYFKTETKDVTEEMIDEYFKSYFEGKDVSYSLMTSPNYGYPHRRITIFGVKIDNKERKLIRKELTYRFGPPFVVKCKIHETNPSF